MGDSDPESDDYMSFSNRQRNKSSKRKGQYSNLISSTLLIALGLSSLLAVFCSLILENATSRAGMAVTGMSLSCLYVSVSITMECGRLIQALSEIEQSNYGIWNIRSGIFGH